MELAEKQELRRRVNLNKEWFRQLRIRRNLERIIFRELVAVFRRWLSSTLFLYTEFGTYQNGVAQARLSEELNPVLQRFYKRVFQTIIEGNIEMNEKKQAEEVFVFGRSIIFEDLVASYFVTRDLILAGVSRVLAEKIDRIIQEGRADDLTLDQIARNVDRVLGPSISARANLIARTETHSAASFANHTYYETVADELDMTMKKKWIATGDERTRDAHSAMNSKPYIDMDQPFIVDGERMMYPGDSTNASAKNIVICRCVVAYVDERDI